MVLESNQSYKIPTKTILTPQDLESFIKSSAKQEYLQFLAELSESISGFSLQSPLVPSKNVVLVCSMLDTLEVWIKEIPPVPTASRFGNPAFRSFMDKLENSLQDLLDFIPLEARQECLTYLLNSFGNKKRIDYGTGHEAHFMIFLLCLRKLKLIHESDDACIVLKVFWSYIKLMRQLQMTYWLEPAGSHGVWGLDDYHFLPFLFGASQLVPHKFMSPKCIHNPEILQEFSKDYMYLSCVSFVNSIKTASLQWHSPMLNDISNAKSWQKVAKGMLLMYEDHVLGKLPIMQHMLFGSLFQFEASKESEFHECDDGHVHAFGQEFPECCGIRVPSAIAATQQGVQMRKPIPFD